MRKRKPIYGLDLIRFLAAMAVFFWHAAYRFFDSDAEHIRVFAPGVPVGPFAIQDYTQWGWIGVQIFFVISGLVIAYSAEGAQPGRFFRGRFARLVPAAAVCVAIIFCIDVLAWGLPLGQLGGEVVRSLLFWPTGGWIAPQFWTLPVEIMFYALVWLMIWAGAVRHLDWLALALLLVSIAYWLGEYAGLFVREGQFFNVLLLKHGLYFAIGICLSSWDRQGFSPLRLIVILAGILAATLEVAHAVRAYGVYSEQVPNAWIAPYLIWLALLGLIVASLRWKAGIEQVVERAHLGGLFRMIGLMTYPLYLVHLHVAGLFMALALGAGIGLWIALLGATVVTLLVSVVIVRWIEPLLREPLTQMFVDWPGSLCRSACAALSRGPQTDA